MHANTQLQGWPRHLLDRFLRQLEGYRKAFTERVFPVFDSIEAEAEEYLQETYRTMGQQPYDDSIDMADIAEAALERGIEHYESLRGVRQSIYTIALAGLYHLLEQQMMFFHRRQVLNPGEENQPSLLCQRELADRLRLHGIDLATLPSWNGVNELRLIANVAKHAEGNSAEQLRSVRPDLFDDPQLPPLEPFAGYRAPVFLPLASEDLYPTPLDLARYTQVASFFWTELIERYFTSLSGSA